MRKLLKSTIVVTVMFLMSCSQEPEPESEKPMPVVNDKNCLPDNIASVEKEIREKFATACAHRGTFKPSTGKTW